MEHGNTSGYRPSGAAQLRSTRRSETRCPTSPAYLHSSVTRSGHAAKWSNAVASPGQSCRKADFRSRTPDESTSGIGATRHASTTALMHVSTTARSCGRPSSESMSGIQVLEHIFAYLNTFIAATDTAASRPCEGHRAAWAPPAGPLGCGGEPAVAPAPAAVALSTERWADEDAAATCRRDTVADALSLTRPPAAAECSRPRRWSWPPRSSRPPTTPNASSSPPSPPTASEPLSATTNHT